MNQTTFIKITKNDRNLKRAKFALLSVLNSHGVKKVIFCLLFLSLSLFV